MGRTGADGRLERMLTDTADTGDSGAAAVAPVVLLDAPGMAALHELPPRLGLDGDDGQARDHARSIPRRGTLDT